MKTEYGLFMLYDADLEAFLPDSAAVFLNEKQAALALAQGILASKKTDEFGERYRYYKVMALQVDVVPPTANEITSLVSELIRQAQFKEKEVKNGVSDKV